MGYSVPTLPPLHHLPFLKRKANFCKNVTHLFLITVFIIVVMICSLTEEINQ